MSHLGMVHTASGRGAKRNQAFAVLSLVSSVIRRKLRELATFSLRELAKWADGCQTAAPGVTGQAGREQ